ncbi:MAG: hypothetical protein ABDK94_09475 [Atribacterota bacterium]
MEQESRYSWTILMFLGVALGVRFILGASVYGYPTDMGCFSGWSEHLARFGFSGFYSGGIFADYPPGYMYPLFLIGVLRNALRIPLNSGVYPILVKLPALLADIVLAYFLYKAGGNRVGRRDSFYVALAFVFNPAVVLNSALWGQIDSFFMVPLVAGVFLLAEGKIEWSTLGWVLAFLVKPQALFFAPLWIFALLEQKDLWVFLRSALTGFLSFVLLSLPFSGPMTVFRIYQGTVGSYPYATLNAFNFMALLGGNWMPDKTKFLFLSYRYWGYLGILVTTLLSAFFFFRIKKREKVFGVASFLAVSVFFLAPRMHERYLFPVLFFLLLWYLFEPERKLLLLYVGLSATFFINVGLVLLLALLYELYHVARFNGWLLSISTINGILWGFLFWYLLRKVKSEGTTG